MDTHHVPAPDLLCHCQGNDKGRVVQLWFTTPIKRESYQPVIIGCNVALPNGLVVVDLRPGFANLARCGIDSFYSYSPVTKDFHPSLVAHRRPHAFLKALNLMRKVWGELVPRLGVMSLEGEAYLARGITGNPMSLEGFLQLAEKGNIAGVPKSGEMYDQ